AEAERHPVASRVEESQVDEPDAVRSLRAAFERRLRGEPAEEIERAGFPCRARELALVAHRAEPGASLPARLGERQEWRVQPRDEPVARAGGPGLRAHEVDVRV